jgi:3-oxoacyl-[acyl-carrier protein] reductase
MLLEDKIAVVYGAAGAVGGAVARAFAREGARVILAGRTLAPLDEVAEGIRAAGGVADTAEVDALDQEAVDAFVDAVVARFGRIDVSFNAVTYGDVQGAPLVDLPTERLARPIANALRTHHLTTRAAARSMVRQGAGVILTVTGHGPPTPGIGSTMVTWDAVQGLLRQFAAELGPKGVRVAWLRTAGFVESILEAPDYGSSYTPLAGRELLKELEAGTMLDRLPSLAEAGDLAAFLASERARSITAAGVNITSGAVAD